MRLSTSTGVLRRRFDYNGDFTLEADNFFSAIPDELVNSSLKYAEQVGRFLINKIKTGEKKNA